MAYIDCDKCCHESAKETLERGTVLVDGEMRPVKAAYVHLNGKTYKFWDKEHGYIVPVPVDDQGNEERDDTK